LDSRKVVCFSIDHGKGANCWQSLFVMLKCSGATGDLGQIVQSASALLNTHRP